MNNFPFYIAAPHQMPPFMATVEHFEAKSHDWAGWHKIEEMDDLEELAETASGHQGFAVRALAKELIAELTA
jgi:hypothetical protein